MIQKLTFNFTASKEFTVCAHTFVLKYWWRWDNGFTWERGEVVAHTADVCERWWSCGGESNVATATSDHPHWCRWCGGWDNDGRLWCVGRWRNSCWVLGEVGSRHERIFHQQTYVHVKVINGRLQRQHYLSHVALHHTHHNNHTHHTQAVHTRTICCNKKCCSVILQAFVHAWKTLPVKYVKQTNNWYKDGMWHYVSSLQLIANWYTRLPFTFTTTTTPV